MPCFSSQSLSSQSLKKQSIYCSTKRPCAWYCHFSLGRKQPPFSWITDHPWQIVAQLTQGINSSDGCFECSLYTGGCAMSCRSQLAWKYPKSPAMRASKPTWATGTVIARSPSDLAAPLGNLQPAAEHSMNHQWPFRLSQLPAIKSTCLVLKRLYQHYEYSAALILKSHIPFLVLKFKTVLNSGKDALMLEAHLCGRRCLTAYLNVSNTVKNFSW